MPASTHETNRWQHAWYPVAFLRDLDPSRPTPFTLMGNDLVLWFERSSGQWRALALGGLQDPSNPLYAPLMDSIQSIELCIPATKEVVNQLSQRMLFAGRDIGPEAMKLRGDLALHNSINPENQINCKELKELQDMSKRVDRQTAQNELALSAGPGRAPTRFQARNPYARGQGQAGAELPVPAQLPGPAIGVGSGPAQGQRNPASVLCYNCQTMGHYANQCPMPKIRPGGPPARPWCGLLSLTLISLFLCVSHTPNAHTFPLLTDYVQQWITGFSSTWIACLG